MQTRIEVQRRSGFFVEELFGWILWTVVLQSMKIIEKGVLFKSYLQILYELLQPKCCLGTKSIVLVIRLWRLVEKWYGRGENGWCQ